MLYRYKENQRKTRPHTEGDGVKPARNQISYIKD